MPESRVAEAPLSRARADFVQSLTKRLGALRAALAELEKDPSDRGKREFLLRRAHAFGSASRVLGFATVAEVVSELERVVARAQLSTKDLAQVAQTLDTLPSLVQGAFSGPTDAVVAGEGRWPVSFLVFGEVETRDAVKEALPAEGVEVESAADLDTAIELFALTSPDIVILDADQPGTRTFFEHLHGQEPEITSHTLVVGTFENSRLMDQYSALGAERLLTKPVDTETWRRNLTELADVDDSIDAYRALGTMTVAEVCDRISDEFKKGLVRAAEGDCNQGVDLGEGTEVMAAVWGAVARVRELLTLESGGAVRFSPHGPEGAIPLASSAGRQNSRGRGGRVDDDVTLSGRRVVVADDDPAVAWFLSGLLRSVGAEVLEAHDGEEALLLTQAEWPDLVVSDILMPRLDGFSMCREIKRDVAVRDVPVILLSWKEDLLQRMRELGADADGYLQKEAAASTVVQRFREVLRPRARVEARMAAGGEVRGRLDGLTTRLVLAMCCQGKENNLRATVRDAFFDYTIQIREGRLVSLLRQGEDRQSVSGPEALGSLLGAGAGRFMVCADTSPVTAEFSGDLRELLRVPIERSRRAQRALRPDRLLEVEELTFAESDLEHYLASTPDPTRSLLRELQSGKSPRALLLSGSVWPDVLERSLADMARRGAILSVRPDLAAEPQKPETDPAAAPEEEPAANPSESSEEEPAADPSESSEEEPGAADPSESPEEEPNSDLVARTQEEKAMPPNETESSHQPEANAPVFTFALSPEALPPVTETAVARDESSESPKERTSVVPLRVRPDEMADDDAWFEGLSDSEPVPAKATDAPPIDVFPTEVATRPGVGNVDAARGKVAPLPETKKIEFPGRKPRGATSTAKTTQVMEDGARSEADRSSPAEPELAATRSEPSSDAIPGASNQPAPQQAPQAASSKGASGGWQKLALQGSLAMVASYLVVSFATGQLGSDAAPAAPEQAMAPAQAVPAAEMPGAESNQLPKATPEPPSASGTSIEVLPIPEGMVLGDGKGVLKVMTGGAHSIYVDGEFAGRGPVRIVPVTPGNHEVEMRLSGVESSFKADVQTGKLTLLKVAEETK